MTDDLASIINTALVQAGYKVLDQDSIRVEARLRNGEDVVLSLYEPKGFPYELPEFKLDESMLPTYGRLPHVSPTGVVCAFDRETNVPNPQNPGGQVVEILERTVLIISDGIEGKNVGDYLDEFLAYWGYDQDTMLPLYSLVDDLDEQPRTLFVFSCGNEDRHLFVCSSYEDAAALAERLDGQQQESDILRCAYLPFGSALEYPFPKTHKEWYERILEDGMSLEFYQKFLQNSDRKKSVIVFSCPYPDGRRVFAAYGHSTIPSMRGFRKGKVPLQVALTQIGEEEVVRYEFLNASNQRLYSRGGNGKVLDMKACIIGCGSLGGYLIDALASCGVEDYALVDNQRLELDNIARHICGFSDIGKKKVQAIADFLLASNPNIKSETFDENAHVLLDKDPVELDSCDYMFVTTGRFPLEQHVVSKLEDGMLHCHVVLMWVEPYAIAAHAIVLNAPQRLQPKMFDDLGAFRYAVVANGQDLYKREAGCQSTYIQYSGLDVKAFAADFVRNLMLGKLLDHNYHYAWYGGVSHAAQYGAVVNQSYMSKADYSSEVQRID